MAKYGGSKDPTYSAVYFPGRYWYAAMSFVYDFGGQIAKYRRAASGPARSTRRRRSRA